MSEVETIRGYHLKRRKGLNHWDALLEEWLLAHERYCRIMKEHDSAHWYKETPNVSILCAAAWRCGRVALQEFRTEKKVQGQGRIGRADLWICTDIDGQEEFIEAKHKFVSLSGLKDKDGMPAIRTSMDEATKDANNSRRGQGAGTAALAVVFASAYTLKSSIKKRKTEERVVEIDKQINEFCEGIKSSADYHALAWCFPKETRTLDGENGYYYPGIAMLVKNIDFIKVNQAAE